MVLPILDSYIHLHPVPMYTGLFINLYVHTPDLDITVRQCSPVLYMLHNYAYLPSEKWFKDRIVVAYGKDR